MTTQIYDTYILFSSNSPKIYSAGSRLLEQFLVQISKPMSVELYLGISPGHSYHLSNVQLPKGVTSSSLNKIVGDIIMDALRGK